MGDGGKCDAERSGARSDRLHVVRAVALIGNAGLSRRNPLERHLRDVLCGRIHTPQDDVVLTSAGRALLERNPR